MKILKTTMWMSFLIMIVCTAAVAVKPEIEKAPLKKSASASVWFLYHGPHPATLSDLLNPTYYTRYYGNPFLLCIGSDKLCAIFADELNPGSPIPRPDLTNNGAGSIGYELEMYHYLGFSTSTHIKEKSE